MLAHFNAAGVPESIPEEEEAMLQIPAEFQLAAPW
jgi:hypothetical protein